MAPGPDDLPDRDDIAAADDDRPTGDDGGTPDGPVTDVPDDASALEIDRLRYLEERALGIGRPEGPDWSLRAPQPQLPRFLQTRRWREYGLSGRLVVVVLIVVGVLGSLMTVFRPVPSQSPAPLPLATSAASVLPGGPGALLPSARVELEGVPLELRRLRPAALVIAPEQCPTCADVVADVTVQAREFGLRTFVVGTAAQTGQLMELTRGSPRRLAGAVVDPAAVLTTLHPGPGPTVVLVHADGVVADVVVDPQPGSRYEGVLARLSQAGAGAAV
jgi:hypothetical protein